MQRASFDPGLTQQFTAPVRRIINKDGSFNVLRRGTTWRDVHPYLYLISIGWPQFLALQLLVFLVVNTMFAGLYCLVGVEHLQGAEASTTAGRVLNAFFFSAHTLTTVGYGSISPRGVSANSVAAFESLMGVLGFAVSTGLMFGRFSKASARIGFSPQMVVAPYQDGTGLEFRVVNRRSNSLVELDVRVMLMTVERENGGARRKYDLLRLERAQVIFLPLTWTVVHPIDEDSPLRGKTAEDLERLQAEVLILMKGYDDTFNQTVLSRHSYRHDEIVWGRRFAPAFSVDDDGDLVLEVSKVGEMS